MDGVSVAESAAFTKGTGVNSPTGVVTALQTAGAGRRFTHATNSAFTVSDLVGTQNALDPRFQDNASWISSLTYLNRIRQLGSSSYSSWTATLNESPVDSILGRPCYEVSDMSTALSSTSNSSFVYGDFRHFLIVDKIGSMRVEPVAQLMGAAGRPRGQAGLYLYFRTGAAPTTATAFVLSVNPGI